MVPVFQHWVEEHEDFLLLLLLFSVFRLFLLILFRLGGFLPGWSGYYIAGTGFVQLSDEGLYPFVHYWMEYPPLFPWLAILAYRFSLLIPPWINPELWFNLILGVTFLPFEIGNFILIYTIGHQLYGRGGAIKCGWFYASLFAPIFTLLGWFDNLPLFFLLLGLYFVLRKRAALAGLTSGIGVMIKPFPMLVAPLALKALPRSSQKTAYAVVVSAAALLIATPFLIINAPFLIAALVNPLYRSPWETTWALLDGYYGSGSVKPFNERFDPASARVAMYLSRLPWLWISLAFALLYLFLYTRRLDWSDKRTVVGFGGLTLSLVLIYSKGWSPQWLVYILPFLILLLPNWRGAMYAIFLTFANFLEFPLAIWVLHRERWLMATAVIFRTALLVLLCVEFAFLLWPSPRFQTVKRKAFVTLLAFALFGVPLVSFEAFQAYTRERYSQDPYREAIGFLGSQPSAGVIFTDESLYKRFYPFIWRGKSLYLLEDRERLSQRLVEVAEAHNLIWVVYTGEEGEVNGEIARWLSEGAFPLLTHWFANCRLDVYSVAELPPLRPLGVGFDDRILLEGYALHKGPIEAGGVLHSALQWRALETPEVDYTVFIHLVDPADRIWSQRDSQPMNGFCPTSSWEVGKGVEDHHGLLLPSDLPPGEYWLRVGLYEAPTGERLLLSDGGDSLLIGPVEVVEGG